MEERIKKLEETIQILNKTNEAQFETINDIQDFIINNVKLTNKFVERFDNIDKDIDRICDQINGLIKVVNEQ